MANEYKIHRVAHANFTYVSVATNVTQSIGTGIIIPKGAIVTGIKFLPGGAITNGSNFKNATVNVYVGTVVMGTNNRVASQALVQTVVGSLGMAAADGKLVPATGEVIVHFASSDSAKTGIAFDADIYVEYLYTADSDTL